MVVPDESRHILILAGGHKKQTVYVVCLKQSTNSSVGWPRIIKALPANAGDIQLGVLSVAVNTFACHRITLNNPIDHVDAPLTIISW